MRRPGGVREHDSIVVELVEDWDPLGPAPESLHAPHADPSAGGGAPWPAIAAVCALVALVSVAAAVGRGDAPSAPVPATTSIVPATSIVADTTGPVAAEPVPDPVVEDAVTFAGLSIEPLPVPEGAAVYLRSPGGGHLLRVDAATGGIADVPDVVGRVHQVLHPRPGADPFVADDQRAAQAPAEVAIGPDGALWMPNPDEHRIDLVAVESGTTVLVTTVTVSREERLIGSTAEGAPVVVAADGRAYTAGAGGARSRLADGAVPWVRAGSYPELVCDDSARCSVRLHGATRDVFSLPYSVGRAYAFDPTGRLAAVVSRSGLRIVPLDGSPAVEATIALAEQRFAEPATVVWLRDGSGIVVSTAQGELGIVDVATGTMRSVDLPAAVQGATVLAVGP
jgi:hypothetical protein